MKVNFTHDNKSYTICTIAEFAELLTDYLMASKPKFSTPAKFVADFALMDTYDDLIIDVDYLDEVFLRTNSWFGVKELGEIGFNDDDDRVLVFDYYGGGRFTAYRNNFFDDEEATLPPVKATLCDLLDIEEKQLTWPVLIQWTNDNNENNNKKETK